MEPRWLWPFELIEKLGEGGMGTVYRARYSGNNRQVAVKLLPAEVASNPVLLARFERELDVLKQLRHPNIVRCFGGKCESEQQFYAMELVDGGTLADLLLRKPLSSEVVIDYALQMCEALQYAHEHGIIHRDVKPGNFLLTKSGQIKLSDFGLASIATTNRLTAAGKTVGTIQYMAPEQIRGKPPLTNRADLYALGCVLFEMITGQPPYLGDNAAVILQAHLKDPIPHAAAMVLDCPLKLDQLICDLMSKDAEQRPATAAEVGWRLEEILQPGRRSGPVEPDLFSNSMSKTLVVTPLQNVAQTLSDAELEASQVRRAASPPMAWVMAALLIPVCIAFWMGWTHTKSEVRRAEKAVADLLHDPVVGKRMFAAQALADFGRLDGSTMKALHAASRDVEPAVRSAALVALAKHASESRSFQSEILQLEKADEDADVRHRAGRTLEAIRNAPQEYSTSRFVIWGCALLVVALGITGGRVLWQRFKPFAA